LALEAITHLDLKSFNKFFMIKTNLFRFMLPKNNTSTHW
jgi:hypothetical protein